MNENILRIAIQKSGRLSEDSLKLIKECGIRFDNGAGKLKTDATNFPAEILFLRDDDIPATWKMAWRIWVLLGKMFRRNPVKM
jgi:ATP phosphoribosyltransferase